MAPIRRYLRITKDSILECRIYLDNPALAASWLLNPRAPVLPKVIESIRHLVLPKLHEERERARGKKGAKKKSIKDVVVGDDFEVSVFLTETDTRHSILARHKHFREKAPQALQSNSSRLIAETNAEPVDLRREDSDGDEPQLRLEDIPLAVPDSDEPEENDDDDDDDDEQSPHAASPPPHKRPRAQSRHKPLGGGNGEDHQDSDKKKMAMDVTYEGFAIWGKVLCLVIKKRDPPPALGNPKTTTTTAATAKARPTGQAMMENWISSTQMPLGQDDDDA